MNTAPAPWTIEKLPLRPGLVVSLALTSLRLRWGRTILTLLTIATSTAFLMYLLNTPRSTDDAAEFEAWGLMLALSLLVSIAGVLNTMLMSVTQRYREIGTMKCLGALDQFVLYSVLLEAAILGLCGAAAGVLVGLVLSFVLGMIEFGPAFWQLWQPSMLPMSVLVSFLAGTGLTTFGAFIPAWIASKMPPMDAMRGEK